MSWIGVGVLKTDVEKTENLLVEETPLTKVMIPLLRGKGSDGENSKERGKNKMKRIVAATMIAALVLPALVGVACGAQVEVINVSVGENNSKYEEVYCDENFYYYVTLRVTKLTVFYSINLTLNVSNQTQTYDSKDIINGKTPPGDYVIKFGPVNFFYDFKPHIAEATAIEYTICWDIWGPSGCDDGVFSPGPLKVIPPEPIIDMYYPPEVAFCEDFNIIAVIEDKARFYPPVLKFINCSNKSDVRPAPIPKCEQIGEYNYECNWTISEKFKEEDVCHEFEVNLTYKNKYHETGPYPIHIRKIVPKIKVYLDKKELSELYNNTIYLEEDTNLTFKAKITDYVEANVSLKLDVYKNNESYWNYTWPSRTIKGSPGAPSLEVYDKCNGDKCNIWFKKERNNFTMILNYNRLNETFNKTYNLNIIPVSVKFENASVDPEVGYWDDKFNYSIWVTASIDLDVNLSIYDPCREPEPWIDLGKQRYTEEDVNRPKKLNWTNEEPFKKYCVGRSKFYFGYLGKETQVFFGPELVKPPPEFDNGTTNPNVTIYCNWSKSSTPCNYSVNVSTEDEYKVRLLVKDPNSNDWIPKGDVKDVSRETKNLVTWYGIKPFESLNIDNITLYIDNETRANYTFEYDGHNSANKNFSGPLLVAAFRDPKIDREEINYNDTFNYSIDVIGSRNLNVTLKYYNGRGWVNASKTEPTKDYIPSEGEKPLTWSCIANETWEKVMMGVEVEGEKKPIEVY